MASTRFTQQHIIELNEKPASSLLMNKELQNIYKGTNELDDEAKIHRAKQADPTLADTAPEKHVTNAQAKKWDDIANTFSGVSPSSFVAATEVVTTATANKILKLNADGKLPTDIVGNATTASDSLLLNGKSDTAFQAVAEKDQPGGYAGLDANGKIDSEWIKDASETVKGVVELATPAEVLAGVDTERAVTPAGFKAALTIPDSLLYSGPRRIPSLTEPIGVVLVQAGGGAGVWDRVDLDGNPVACPPGYFSSRSEYLLNTWAIDNQCMVEIKKFHYANVVLSEGPYAGKRARFLNKTAFSGSQAHPAFLNSSGVEIDQFYVGAYEGYDDGGSKVGSTNNKAPLVSINFATMLSRCAARNADGVTGFQLIDIYQLAAIQYLALVEMGNPDAQVSLGRGNCDASAGGSAMQTGTTTAIWRALHELWGNVWMMVQGIESRGGVLWVWNKDGTRAYVNTGFTLPSAGWVVDMSVAAGATFDLGALFIPGETAAASDSGSWSDYFWIAGGPAQVCYHGGAWSYGPSHGLFTLNFNASATRKDSNVGGRLAKV